MNNSPHSFSSFPTLTGDGLAYYADGTINFVHGFPFACISLGLIDQPVPVLGVIYNPFFEHLYTGVRGAGSFLHTHTPAALGSAIGPRSASRSLRRVAGRCTRWRVRLLRPSGARTAHKSPYVAKWTVLRVWLVHRLRESWLTLCARSGAPR